MAYYQGDYYQGDYYQGDYYQGDPFLGAILGGAVSWLGKKIFRKKAAGVLASKTVTARIAGLPGLARRNIPGIAGAVGVGAVMARAPGMQIPLPGGGVMRPGRILPGGVPFTSPGCCPPGQHFNKGVTRSGAPPGTVCVTNRRMNVANPRALRRSLRRVAGFGKLAQRSKRDIRRAAKAIGA